LPPHASLAAGNVNQNPAQRMIWFTFGRDFSPRRALPAGNVNQTPDKDRFGLHSAMIPAPGGRCPPEM